LHLRPLGVPAAADQYGTRTVDEYVREVHEGRVRYTQQQTGVDFPAYVRANGYKVISVSGAQQLAYGCNVLNLGHSNIIAVHEETARAIAQSPDFRGRVRSLDFSAITCMYGAVHCATQVVRRRAVSAAPESQHLDVAQWIKQLRLAADGTSSSATSTAVHRP
jgi:arginine deiminase